MEDNNSINLIQKAVEQLNPIDDLMFAKMAEDKDFLQELLRVILNDKELVVLSNIAQKQLTNLKGRSVRIDAYCKLGNGKEVNVEVQKSDNDDHQRRVRYNTSLLTVNVTNTGTKFEDVPDVIGIYISKFDIFNKGLPIYHIKRVIEETGDTVENGLYEVYVNSKAKDGSEISDYMNLFVDDDAYDFKRFPNTSEQKRIYKQTEKGKQSMSDLIEKIKEDAIIKGREEGREEGRKQGAFAMLFSLVEKGLLSLHQAAEQLGVSEEVFSQRMAAM